MSRFPELWIKIDICTEGEEEIPISTPKIIRGVKKTKWLYEEYSVFFLRYLAVFSDRSFTAQQQWQCTSLL